MKIQDVWVACGRWQLAPVVKEWPWWIVPGYRRELAPGLSRMMKGARGDLAPFVLRLYQCPGMGVPAPPPGAGGAHLLKVDPGYGIAGYSFLGRNGYIFFPTQPTGLYVAAPPLQLQSPRSWAL